MAVTMATSEPKQKSPRFEKLAPPRLGKAQPAPAPVQQRTDVVSAEAVNPATTPPPALPLQNAVAITYQSSAGAPKIVAKGRGLVAEQIIARAREHGVFVHESKELVALLMQVELDDHIPPTLYRAVAELLAWLYRIEAARLGGGKV